jgi:hypothetical protein
MISAKFKVGSNWEYRDFNSQPELDNFLLEYKGYYSEYQIKPIDKGNWLTKWWKNISHTKSNWKKVKSSPFASLQLAYKARIIIVSILIPYLLWMTYKMVRDYHATGIMGTFGRLVSIGVMAFISWKVYQTIPMAKKQIEYYKKFPHVINYCPTDTKETVDEILSKIKENKKEQDTKKQLEGGFKNDTIRKKEKRTTSSPSKT